MKNMLFILICMCLASIAQAAIVAFDAEDDSVYYQAGANWTTVENENALGGECITPTTNLPPQTDENTRFYSFQLPAGTYHMFIRVNIAQGGGNDDSFYLSNDSLSEDAPMTDYNSMDGTDIDGNSIEGDNFGWLRARASWSTTIRTYVMDADGTAYFKIGPREDGLYIDALAFVPEADTDTVTGAELDEAVISRYYIQGAATDPIPSGETPVDSQTMTAVSWTAPVDPNLASVTGYDVVFGTEPNMLLNPVYSVTVESLPLDGVNGPAPLTFDETYYWRVDSHVVWDSNEITGSFNQTVEGFDWFFSTLPDDLTPVVDLGDNIVTSVTFDPVAALAGTITEDYAITAIEWEVSTTATPDAMQMITRSNDLSAVTDDPNLLMDWIGNDTRQPGNPMYLTLKGLPAGTYDWVSYHHDAENQTGTFDVTLYDASGTAETTDIAYRNGNSLPVTTLPLTITSNGVDDVVLSFDLQEGTFFVMNGFELEGVTDVSGTLDIDFSSTASVTDANAINMMNGFEVYKAWHETPDTFTEQGYSAFGTTVSILPEWGGKEAMVTDTTNDPSSASQSATFSTDWPGSYIVQLTAWDDAEPAQTGSDTVAITAASNPCAAAQEAASWTGFSDYDSNEDCQVNLDDFANVASEWLDDRNMTAQE